MSDDTPRPGDDDVAALIRALLDFDLPEACVPGVRDNLAALRAHGRRLHDD